MKQIHALITMVLLSLVMNINAQEARLVKLTNSNGMEAIVSNYGARLVSLTAHNWNGRLEPVVKGTISWKTTSKTLH